MKYGNLILALILFLVIIASQFIIGRKQLEFGFAIDIWNLLVIYKQNINHLILDMPNAWREIGAHNFAHTYYVGILYEFFKYNYLYYNITHQLFKALAALSLFPLIYQLYKSKFLALLATFLYGIHFSTFGGFDDPARGADFLVIICMNLFLTIYVHAAQRKNFNLKVLFLLFILLITAAFFDITRFYPFLLSLPFLELLIFYQNRSSANFKKAFLRILFFFFPFIIIFLFSPHSILDPLINYSKPLREMLTAGNLQLFLVPFASLGSTFIPPHILLLFGPPYYQQLEEYIFSRLLPMFTIFYPLYILIGFLISSSPKRFILRAMLISSFFSIIAFIVTNHWPKLDPLYRSPVDPGVYFVPSIAGLFIFACSISLFIEYFANNQKNPYLLGLSVSVFSSLLYIVLTWVLAPVNAIFTGVSAYLNIPAIGTSLFLAIILYFLYKKILPPYPNVIRQSISCVILMGLLFTFFKISAESVDQVFSNWLKNGLRASEQERLREAFWKEVGKDKRFNYQNPALFYLDSHQDYDNGYFYSTAFIWKISAYLFLERGQTLSNCDLIVINDDFKKLKIRTVNNKKVIVQDKCNHELEYSPENFYAFKLINRNIYPNRLEVLKKLGLD